MLHTVNKSPFSSSSLENCLELAKSGDAILLYEDGVLGAQAGNKSETLIQSATSKFSVYALEEDLSARGIQNLISGIKTISYDGFVDLVAEHKVVPWL